MFTLKINIIFFIVFITHGFAQESFTINGIIKDKQTKNSLAFTVVSIKHTNQATVANEQGNFSFSFIKTTNDTIAFSRMGFNTKEIPLNMLSNYDSLNIELEEKVVELVATQITGLTAKEVVRKAIKSLKQNFPDTNLLLQSFYRQYHKEDNHYVRLIEAVVITNEQSYRNYITSVKSEKVAIKALRRSDVFEENKAQHGDHLMDLLNENPFKFPIGSVLNLKGIDYFNFHFAESNSPDETVIEFSSTLSATDKIQSGFIFIDDQTFFIKRLIIETFPNQNSKVRHFAAAGEPYFWKFRNGKYDISFRKFNGQIIFDRIIKSYTHYLFDTRVNALAHIVEENFELQSDNSININPSDFHFKLTSNLYSQQYLYDEEEWKYFPLLAEEIKSEMEKQVPINEQFINNGK